MFVVNVYAPASRANPVNDRFPVNTYVGNRDQVLKCLADLFDNPDAGIARAEVVIDPNHPAVRVGQAPMDLAEYDDGPKRDLIGASEMLAVAADGVERTVRETRPGAADSLRQRVDIVKTAIEKARNNGVI